MMKVKYGFIIGFVMIYFLLGCQSKTENFNEFDSEKAALARLKLGLGYLTQAKENTDKSNDDLKASHYNLMLANQYSPDNPNVMLGLALFDQHVSENKEAEMIYERITKMEPNNGLYQIHYGTFLCATARYMKAVSHFKKIISLGQSQWKSDAFEQLGYCAIQNQDMKQADEAFHALFQYDASKRKNVENIANFYRKKGDKDIADYLVKISK